MRFPTSLLNANSAAKGWLLKNWLVMLIFLISGGLRFMIYDRNAFAPGWDSYFYIVQIKSFIEEGAMHSSRLSLFYPFLILVQLLTQDYELTYKIVASLLVGLFTLQAFKVSLVLSNNPNVSHLVAAYTVFSPQLTYFGSQYAKNLLGLILFLWLIHSLLQSKVKKTGLLVLLNFFGHKLTAGLSLVLLLARFLSTKIEIKYLLRATAILALIGLLLVTLPMLFGIDDFKREGMGLSTSFNWPSLSYVLTFREVMDISWMIEVLFCNVLFVIAIIFSLKDYRLNRHWIPIMLVFTLLTLPFLQWSLLGFSFRALMVFLILCPILIGVIPIKLSKTLTFGSTLLFISFGLTNSRTYSSQAHDPPYGLYRIIAHKISSLDHVQPELIIAHKSLAEYITFKSGIDALPWEPEYEIEEGKLWRICAGVTKKSFQYFGKEVYTDDSIYQLSPNYMLVREDLWDSFLIRVKDEDPDFYNELLTWKNPHEVRPSYLMKYKK